jgi:serine/threonine-protein kinase HipA
MAHELAVWLFANQVGTLSFDAGRLNFRYRPDWLAESGSVALSCSLPLQAEPFEDQQCRPFFAGLLPEGNLRRLIARQYQVSSQNDFALLNAIGGECAGAITFLPIGNSLPAPDGARVEWLDEPELALLLNELPQRPMLAGRDGLRLSLAGAQDKLPVVFDGRRIGLTREGQPSTHILKPPIPAVEGSVLNEAFCLALANAMRLQAAEANIHPIGDHHVLLVARYDRQLDSNGQLSRLHQEDFCQALCVVPEMKYQNEGGPDLHACFDLLRRVVRPSAPQVLRFLDYVVFNVLIGNHDAHAKNFSLLYNGAIPVLAPLYDVLSTAVYPDLTLKMAMKLGGKYNFNEVQVRHWDQFAEEAGLSKAQARKRILNMARELPVAARRLQAAGPFAAQPLIAKIVEIIEQRAELTVRRLSASLVSGLRD